MSMVITTAYVHTMISVIFAKRVDVFICFNGL